MTQQATSSGTVVAVTDLPAYLRGLEMQLIVKPFDRVGLQRIVQLINKSNQFNLTTRRYTDEDVLAVMADPDAFGLQLRLLDRFGDNGVIAIIIGRLQADRDLLIDTWLMKGSWACAACSACSACSCASSAGSCVMQGPPRMRRGRWRASRAAPW